MNYMAIPGLSKLTLEDISELAFGKDLKFYANNNRTRPLPQQRMVLCYIGYNYFNYSYSELGRIFKRNHATIIHGVNMVKSMLDGFQDEILQNEFNKIPNDTIKRLSSRNK